MACYQRLSNLRCAIDALYGFKPAALIQIASTFISDSLYLMIRRILSFYAIYKNILNDQIRFNYLTHTLRTCRIELIFLNLLIFVPM